MKLYQLIGLTNVNNLLVMDENDYVLIQEEKTDDYIIEPKRYSNSSNGATDEHQPKDIIAVGSFYTCNEFSKQLISK